MDSCPHCARAVFRPSSDGTKLKAKTRILILHKSGAVEINCGHCGKGILLPLMRSEGEPELKKAYMPKLVVRRKA